MWNISIPKPARHLPNVEEVLQLERRSLFRMICVERLKDGEVRNRGGVILLKYDKEVEKFFETNSSCSLFATQASIDGDLTQIY